jgi:hypothetical protein
MTAEGTAAVYPRDASRIDNRTDETMERSTWCARNEASMKVTTGTAAPVALLCPTVK